MGDTESGLQRLAELALEAGRSEIAALAEERIRRTRAGETYVACVGQFKRGKSSLLNRLIGRPILPSGTLPLTSIPTVVRHGSDRLLVHLADRIETCPLEHLARWTTEAGNPGNQAQVQWAEAFIRSDLLASGLCFIDTPGLGSIDEAHDLRVRAALPRLDAMLMVVGVDPPITALELALLNDPDAPATTLIALGKCDRVRPEEVREVRGYLDTVLGARGRRPEVGVFEVSATAPPADWPDLGRLATALTRLAEDGGRDARRKAAERELGRLTGSLASDLRWELDAIDRPADEARRDAESCRQLADRMAHWPRELRAILRSAEAEWHARLERRLAQELDRMRVPIGPLDSPDPETEARARVAEWRGEAERLGVTAAEELWRRVESEMARLTAAAPELGELVALAPVELPPTRFVFHERLQAASAGPFGWLTQWLWGRRPRSVRRRYEDLVEVNGWRVVGDTRDRVADVREALERRAEQAAAAIRALAARLADTAEARAAGRGPAAMDRRQEVLAWSRRLDALRAEANA